MGRLAILILQMPSSVVWSQLSHFIGRLLLEDPTSKPIRERARELMISGTFDYHNRPQGSIDYHMCLYQQVYHKIQLDSIALPTILPNSEWVSKLEDEEQKLINICLLYLSQPETILVYLNLFAGLTCQQIAGIYHSTSRPWTSSMIAKRLGKCWSVLLQLF